METKAKMLMLASDHLTMRFQTLESSIMQQQALLTRIKHVQYIQRIESSNCDIIRVGKLLLTVSAAYQKNSSDTDTETYNKEALQLASSAPPANTPYRVTASWGDCDKLPLTASAVTALYAPSPRRDSGMPNTVAYSLFNTEPHPPEARQTTGAPESFDRAKYAVRAVPPSAKLDMSL